MNKKKFTVLALLLIVVLTLTSCVLVACNTATTAEESSEETTIEATPDLLINNSDFKVVDTSVETYPRSVTSWTGGKQYSTTKYRDDVTAGVISLDEALYAANKEAWGDDKDTIRKLLLAGGRYGKKDEIKHALMIYMPKQGKDDDGKEINGPTAYGFTSSSFTLDKSSYYKLSVDVLTYKIEGKAGDTPGARIFVSSNTYAEFSGINTNGKWKTYEIYIETSPASTSSLTLMLGLGKYQSYYENGLTTGYVFFDNVELTKIADDANTPAVEGKTAYDNAYAAQLAGSAQLNGKTVTTASLKVPNGHFDFGSTSPSNSQAPSSWSLVTGNSGKDDAASTGYGHNSIINLQNFATDYENYAKSYQMRASGSSENFSYNAAANLGGDDGIGASITAFPSDRLGNNVFMLSQQYMTAQGIKSSRSITIEKNKMYALSVDIYTYAIHGAGVSLILSGSDGKDIVIKGISQSRSTDLIIGQNIIDTQNGGFVSGTNSGETTGEWKTYTFYIQGNQFRNYSYNMTIWLGTEGTDSNHKIKYHSFDTSNKNDLANLNATSYDANGTFSNGWVFIDELVLDELEAFPDFDARTDVLKDANNTDQTLDCSKAGYGDYYGLYVDLSTDNILENILNATNEAIDSNVDKLGAGAPVNWKSNFDAEDMSKPVVSDIISEGVVDISSEVNFNGLGAYPKLPYDIVSKKAYSIYASSNSAYEVETSDIVIEANKFYRLSLWVKTVDVSSASGAYVYLINRDNDDATLSSFTKINTADYDEYHKDWCEITIVIRGAENKNTTLALRLALGTGNRWASTLTSGAIYVANINMTTITYANYNGTSTGTYTKSVNLSKSYSYTVTNGSFDSYDLDDENLEADKAFTEQSVAATPENWTINDKTLDINGKNDTSLFAGIIALNKDGNTYTSSNQATTVTGLPAETFNQFYINKNDEYSVDYLNSLAGPYMLAIGSVYDSEKSYAAGFASSNISLSANTFYSLSVYVKTCYATTASIFLTGESSVSGDDNYFSFTNTEENGDWTKYTFYIEVGNTSVSVKLNLWLGKDAEYMNVEEEEALSSGAVFFDNVVLAKIDEDVFKNADGDSDKNIKLSFITDSFDALSSSVESRGELTKPDNWSGAADTNQSTSNSKYGIVYGDGEGTFYETETVNGVLYARILGSDYDEKDVTITNKNITDAMAKEENQGKSRDEVIAELTKEALDKKKEANWIPVEELTAHSGNRMLVINNIANSAYIYTSSSNTFTENSYYRVSVWVRTYGISGKSGDKKVGANIELYLGSANVTGDPLIFEAINTDDGENNNWTKYEFYVKTLDENVTSVTLRLSLGRYSTSESNGVTVEKGLTSGYAMFDDVTFEKVTLAEYIAADEIVKSEENLDEKNYIRTRQVEANTSIKGEETGDGETETPTTNKFNLDNLWWMIPTIVIGLVIIIAVIVLVIRKIRPAAKRAAKKISTPMSSEMLDKKRSRYDEGKE